MENGELRMENFFHSPFSILNSQLNMRVNQYVKERFFNYEFQITIYGFRHRNF